MEFLRFGSSIPGSYWGCCACCIIQNFKVEPDAPASIQLVEGDGGTTLGKFAGKTYEDIFMQRLRYGTFSMRDMPNHTFLAILSESQLSGSIGKKWLAILKREGFEFLRKVNNSVWNVVNYIFILNRNVGSNAVADMFTPPKQWTDLPSVVPETWQSLDGPALTKSISEAQKPLYDALPSGVFYTEDELRKEGIPITYAGRRSHTCGQGGDWQPGFPQQSEEARKAFEAAIEARMGKKEATPSLRAATAKAVPPSPIL